MLWLLLPAFADPPSDEALAAICAGRTPCRHVSHQYAGTDPLGLDLQVVELLLSDTEESEARGPAYGGECAPFEWHVVRYDADEKLAGHRKLLELCNDGYGASGVGDDRVEVSDNRLVHDQMGGSSWRWSQGQAVQLWPERVLEEWTGSWRSPMGHTQETRWSWVSRSGWQSVELVSCDSQESPDDAEPLAVAGPVIPRVPEQEGPGPCGATVHAGNDRGLVIHGSPSTPDDGRIVVLSSTAAQMGKMDFDDLQFEKRGYKPWPAYGQSKLANQLFAQELQRRLARQGSGIRVTAAHPGWTATDLQRTSGLASFFNPILAMKPPQGALPTLRAAVDPDAAPAAYYGPHGLMQMRGYPVPLPMVPAALVSADAERLWEVSEALTEVRYPAES